MSDWYLILIPLAVNNRWREIDIYVSRESIQQWFSLTKSLVKIIAESPHSWQKIGIHSISYIILHMFEYRSILEYIMQLK